MGQRPVSIQTDVQTVYALARMCRAALAGMIGDGQDLDFISANAQCLKVLETALKEATQPQADPPVDSQ